MLVVTYWACAFVKTFPCAISSATRDTAGSNIRLAAATTTSSLLTTEMTEKCFSRKNLTPSCVEGFSTSSSLYVEGQKLSFFHSAFEYDFCVSFSIAWRDEMNVENSESVSHLTEIFKCTIRWSTCVSDALSKECSPEEGNRLNWGWFVQHGQSCYSPWYKEEC